MQRREESEDAGDRAGHPVQRGAILSGGERGLLSLAFHPQYATNKRVYVYFTNLNGDIRIVRYNASTPETANEASADTVIKIAHPLSSSTPVSPAWWYSDAIKPFDS